MRSAVLGLFVLALTAILNAPFADAPVTGLDEGSLLAYPGEISAGRWPYRDFVTFYGPGNPVLLADVYEVAGASVPVERAVTIFYKGLLAFVLALAVAPYGRVASWVVAAMATVLLIGAGPPAVAILPGVACVVGAIALGSAHTLRSGRALASGALLAAAIVFRPDLVIAVALAAAAIAIHRPRQVQKRLGAGFALGVLPLVAAFIAAGLDNLVDNLRDIRRSGPGRRIALADSPGDRTVRFVATAVGGGIVFGLIGAWLLRRTRKTSASAGDQQRRWAGWPSVWCRTRSHAPSHCTSATGISSWP